jgi:hypothetical protein
MFQFLWNNCLIFGLSFCCPFSFSFRPQLVQFVLYSAFFSSPHCLAAGIDLVLADFPVQLASLPWRCSSWFLPPPRCCPFCSSLQSFIRSRQASVSAPAGRSRNRVPGRDLFPVPDIWRRKIVAPDFCSRLGIPQSARAGRRPDFILLLVFSVGRG